MRLTVMLFASYADAFGADRVDLDLPDGAAVSDVVARLQESGGRLPPRPLVAVNRRYAAWSQVVRAGDEVAVVPPVAGG